MADCCRQDRKIDFNACNKPGDKSQQSCKQTLSYTILNLNVSFKTGPEFLTYWTSKISGFSRPHEFTKPVGLRKSSLKNGFRNVRFRCADSLVSCGRKAESYLKSMRFQKYTGPKARPAVFQIRGRRRRVVTNGSRCPLKWI